MSQIGKSHEGYGHTVMKPFSDLAGEEGGTSSQVTVRSQKYALLSDCQFLRPDDPKGRGGFPSEVPPDVGVWSAIDLSRVCGPTWRRR